MSNEPREIIINPRQSGYDPTRALTEPRLVRVLLIALSLLFLGLFLFVPLAVVFATALEKGIQAYGQAVLEKDALSAIRLTLLTTFISVVLNTLFGVASAWAITRFQFPGKNLLITLIDLPFTVSPVVSGLIFVLLFGLQGYFGHWLADHNLKICRGYSNFCVLGHHHWRV